MVRSWAAAVAERDDDGHHDNEANENHRTCMRLMRLSLIEPLPWERAFLCRFDAQSGPARSRGGPVEMPGRPAPAWTRAARGPMPARTPRLVTLTLTPGSTECRSPFTLLVF